MFVNVIVQKVPAYLDTVWMLFWDNFIDFSFFCLCSCYYKYCFYFICGKPESPTVSVLESGHLARTLTQAAFSVCWRSFLHSLLSPCETLCSRIVSHLGIPQGVPLGKIVGVCGWRRSPLCRTHPVATIRKEPHFEFLTSVPASPT